VLSSEDWEATSTSSGLKAWSWCTSILPTDGVYTDFDCFVKDDVVNCKQSVGNLCKSLLTRIIDIEKYGFAGEATLDENTTFMDYDLTSPVLNILALHVPTGLRQTLESSSGGSQFPSHTSLSDLSRLTWKHGNETYDLAEMKQRGKCQPVLVRNDCGKPS
jgi:hypothetical protein